MRGRVPLRGAGWRTTARGRVALFTAALAALGFTQTTSIQPVSPITIQQGRITVVAPAAEAQFARVLLKSLIGRDSFPGLPRPTAAVRIAITGDEAAFRALIGPGVPEWGIAVAIPAEQVIVMRGHWAGARDDPAQVLRHELAHLALHEALGDLPPRWFDEGYASFAAGELSRDEILATNMALVLGPIPSLDSLDAGFAHGETEAAATYALAHRAVADLAALDPEMGLARFFRYWRETRSLDRAVRQAYLITLDAFEVRWQQQTRRRFGIVALFADLTLIGVGVAFVGVPLLLFRKRRQRQRLAELRALEVAAERKAAESALAELLRTGEGSADPAATDDGRAS